MQVFRGLKCDEHTVGYEYDVNNAACIRSAGASARIAAPCGNAVRVKWRQIRCSTLASSLSDIGRGASVEQAVLLDLRFASEEEVNRNQQGWVREVRTIHGSTGATGLHCVELNPGPRSQNFLLIRDAFLTFGEMVALRRFAPGESATLRDAD